jgi:Protein of unknown function (DUF433)
MPEHWSSSRCEYATHHALCAQQMGQFDRITFDSGIMGGRACIRGMRIPVSVIVGQRELGFRSLSLWSPRSTCLLGLNERRMNGKLMAREWRQSEANVTRRESSVSNDACTKRIRALAGHGQG